METTSQKSSDAFEVDGKIQISVELNYMNRVNFAVQQNLISIFQELVVSNDSEIPAENLRVVLKSEPRLFEPIEIRIDRIEPQTRLRVEKFVEKPNVALLSQISERLQGEIEVAVFDVEPSSENATPLFSQRYPTTIFPWDEWIGNSVYPSLLAAFVTPNADGAVRLASDACEIMKSKGEKETLESYQSCSKERVYEIVQAVYEAVLRQGIRYAVAPSSFESQGQRTRFVDRILNEKLANCLDFSTLFASILEYCGLNPIIFLLRGHAFVGCHLLDETFSEAYVDAESLQAIRKRVDLDQIVVFETTAVADGTRMSFAQAEEIGKSRLKDEEDFEGALDVKRARREQIRPIPLKREKDGEQVALDSPTSASVSPSDSTPRTLAKEIELTQNSTPKSRIERWKQNLLDLSLRNKLLNFVEGNSAITLLFPQSKLAELEDRLCEGKSYDVAPSTPEVDKKNAESFQGTNYQNSARFSEENLIEAFRRGRLLALPGVDLNETNKRLTALSRAASTSASESGVNSLFLAFGTVERFDEKAGKKRRAPLLLIPVKLTGNAQKNNFSITRSDEDATLNATLLELIRRDFGKEIRGLNPSDLPTDENGVDVEQIFQIFRQELLDLSGWELKAELTLGLFSFQKYVMWSDLNAHMEELTDNPIVRHLVETPQEAYSDGIPLVEVEKLDSEYSFSDVVTPLSADSSQLAAILTAERGKSFVLQGPPGTGKSQTIANIISYCLYRGQRVLFVAEKRAALEVVHRRLRKLGLGAFCLELHSNKSGKRQILDQLNESLEFADGAKPRNWDAVTGELETLKRSLNEYVEELHRARPNDLTFYRALAWLASHETLKKIAESVKTERDESFATLSAERFDALLKLGERLREAVSSVSETTWDDLRGVALDEWSLSSIREIATLARTVREEGELSRDETRRFAASLGVDGGLTTVDDYKNLWALGRTLGTVDFTTPRGFYSRDWDETASKFRQYLALEQEVEESVAALYQYGWNVLCQNRELGATFQRGVSNDFGFNELRFELQDAFDGLTEQEASTRQIRRDFAVVCSEFYTTIQKISRRVGLKENFGERAVWRVGELLKTLTVVKSPKQGFLLGDRNDLFTRTKKHADALRARLSMRELIVPFDCDAVLALNLPREKSDVDAIRLPDGIFKVATLYDACVLTDDAYNFARDFDALLKKAAALRNASIKAFETLGVKDELNEKNVSTYRPIFKALTNLPPRSKGFLSDDWSLVAPRLRRCVEIGERHVDALAALDGFDLNVVLNFDVKSAKQALDGAPSGVFAFANVRKQVERSSSTFSGFSLDDDELDGSTTNRARNDASAILKTSGDPAALDDFSRKIRRLMRATGRIAEEMGVKTQIDEASAFAIYQISSLTAELAAPIGDFLSDDWNEFSREARTLIASGVQNESARNALANFDLDKIASFDVDAARAKQTRVSQSFFLWRRYKKRAFVAELKALASPVVASTLTFEETPTLFDAIEKYVGTKRTIDGFSQVVTRRFGKYWNEGRPDWKKLERLVELGTRIVQATSERPIEFESGSPLESLGRFWFAVERSSSPEYAALHEFNDAWESYARDLVGFVERVERIQDDLTSAPKEFEKYADVCADRFGEDWRGFDSDWSVLTEYVDSGDRIADAVRSIFPNEERVARYLQALGKIWNRENVEKGAFGTVLREFCDSWTSCSSNLLEFASDFNAWKDNCQRQEEIIRLESSIISERFGSYEPSEWERVAEAGNEIVNQVGKLFTDAASRETFLKKIDEFWQALSVENSEDALLLDAFLANWKTYEEESERFFNSLDELCPKTSAFEAEATALDVSKIDLTNLAASLVRHADAYSRFKRCEDEIGAFSSLAIKDGKYKRQSAERVQRVVERIDELAKSVSSSASRFERVPSLADDSPFFEVDSFDAERLNRLRDMIGAILERSEKPEEFGAQAQTLENAFGRLQESSRRLKDLLKFDARFDDATFADAELDFANRILRAENELRLWIDWNQVKSKASLEFPKLIELIERRKIENSQIADVVRYALYDKFADDVVDATTALKEFIQQPNGREQKIERFKRSDREYSSLSQRLVVAKLTQNLPTRRNEEAPRETELGKLRREINAKRHAKSVRTILGDIPTLLPKLKPCLLASPLSVAQYFPPDGEKYDLVIFDEASQIPVWDAIGAVARGKRLIVVGDSKQLPPTSFFQRAASEDEDELNEFSEPESVLDECVGAQIPEIQLRWHYRSRREGLIAFSNSRYYDDKLYTFPSVDRTNSGVRFVYVEKGRYDRGGSKTNQVEARALVDEVARRLSNPDFAGKSLGIVTFNEAQKNAIEDLLDEERRNRPEMEPFFSADYFEPVFVKNLENVQGDERDVMYFSICYGPDARGVVSNNFGPLNKSGGERRLNVAITRAKEENVVFSSIRASELKLTSVSSERRGARDLKEFLEYAESGGVRLTTTATTNSEYDVDASFEEEIAKFLRSKEYIVKTRVGRSKCRVDLAIVAPDAPDEYVVGIVCDGTAYRSSSTTRDRDLLRQSVLEGLGWRVVRVWSTSWAYDRANAEKKLLKDVDDAFKDRRLKRLERESQICDVVPSDSEPPTRYESSLDDAIKFEGDASSAVDSRDAFVRDYPSLAYLDEDVFQKDGDFYDDKNLRTIKRQLARIVEVESPITESLILERIKRVWQISRAGTQIKAVVQSCLRNVARTKQSDGTRVYWSSKEAPSTFLFYRSGGDRKFSDIPLQEFFNAVDRVKAEYGDFTDDDGLYREALKRFDVQRLTQSIKATIEREARNR